MALRRWMLSMLFLGNFAVAAGDAVVVPSDPATWYGDLRSLIVPTEECPGGTVEQLGKHVGISAPYSARASGSAERLSLLALRGIEDSDGIHEFYFTSELPGGSFWGFSGYLVSRGLCVIHTRVTTIDN